jgi:putative chitinase
MIPVNGDTMFKIAPRFSGKLAAAQAHIINQISPVLASILDEYEINTRLRIAHFLAQTCHESAGFRTTEEFASGDAYEGRKNLGNTQPGDGRRYKGRGLLQLTGRANYRKYGEALGVDLENNPTAAADPQLSLRIACEYWKDRKINPPCDSDDIVTVTLKINGGDNGLPDRRALTAKAKVIIAAIQGNVMAAAAPPLAPPVLRRGSEGPDVTKLQRLLRDLNFPVAVDGEFGPGTEVAVMTFQTGQGLEADGVVAMQTWNAIAAAVKKAA